MAIPLQTSDNEQAKFVESSNAPGKPAIRVANPDGTKLVPSSLPITEPLVSAALIGQTKIAVTATAVQLAANVLSNGVILTAKSTNTAAISVGGSGVNNTVDGTGNGYILEAGASISFAVTNTNVLYINGTANDVVSFGGS